MKIVLIHAAQVVSGKKVEQHLPGAKLNVDDDQANRLISNGYARPDKPDEDEDKDPVGGTGGTGGSAANGNGSGAGNQS